MERRQFVTALLIATIILGLAVAGLMMNITTVHASTNIGGIIDANTTWTKANSPYTLTAPIDVKQGAILKIEPGVTIDLGNYYIQVEGTLYAQGTNTENIQFNSHAPSYTDSLGYNGMCEGVMVFLSSGSLIENAVISSNQRVPMINVDRSYAKINNCTILHYDDFGSGRGIVVNVGAGNNDAFPIVSNNTLIAAYQPNNAGDTGIIVTSPGASPLGTALICNNVVSGWALGIGAYGGTSPTIQNNLIVNNKGDPLSGYGGIATAEDGTIPLIQNNTIAGNSVGFNFWSSISPTIIYNNIENNDQYSIYLNPSNPTTKNIDAANNWWGTTDAQTINQTIYDSKKNFHFGTVNFVPFLIEPNPAAPAHNSALPNYETPEPSAEPTTTPNSTQVTPSESSSSSISQPSNTEPSQDSSQPDSTSLQLVIIVIVVVIIVVGTIVFYKKVVNPPNRKSGSNKSLTVENEN